MLIHMSVLLRRGDVRLVESSRCFHKLHRVTCGARRLGTLYVEPFGPPRAEKLVVIACWKMSGPPVDHLGCHARSHGARALRMPPTFRVGRSFYEMCGP